MNSKRGAQRVEDPEGKKCDLPLVIFFEIEVAIAANASPGDALDPRHFDSRKGAGLLFVMSDKIMAGRNVEVTDFHRAIITREAAGPNE